MKIETERRGRVTVTVTDAELHGYGVRFSEMSLSDGPTRVMLRDLLSLLEHMGLRTAGERVTVECAPGRDGVCILFLTGAGETVSEPPADESRGETYLFALCDDLLDAIAAGALPAEGRAVSCGDAGASVAYRRPLSPAQHALLMEFASGSAPSAP